ncbi:hypothetical protein [Joostella sp. CR20]|uniref:hypothetical protein n=1 Tax=Joostella sp. CR20 TaxID=2804312 RepID=UPI00313CF991
MKLTKEQIQTIEYALGKRGVDYIDLKYELLDHIATEVEQLMTDDATISFEEACNIAFEKWKGTLKTSSSFWLGIVHSAPKIVIDSCVSIVKDLTYKLIGYGVLISLLIFLILKVYPLEFSDSLLIVIGVLQYAIGTALLVLFLIIKRSNYKTSYSFVFNVNAIPFALYYVLFNVGFEFYVVKSQDFDLINIFIQVLMILYPIYGYRMFKKHFESRKNILTTA